MIQRKRARHAAATAAALSLILQPLSPAISAARQTQPAAKAAPAAAQTTKKPAAPRERSRR